MWPILGASAYPVLLRVETLNGDIERMLLRQVLVVQEGFVGKVQQLCQTLPATLPLSCNGTTNNADVTWMLQRFCKTAATRASWTQQGLLILLPSAVHDSMSENDRL